MQLLCTARKSCASRDGKPMGSQVLRGSDEWEAGKETRAAAVTVAAFGDRQRQGKGDATCEQRAVFDVPYTSYGLVCWYFGAILPGAVAP